MKDLQAIVLLSGGLDSSVALALALRDGFKIPMAITFDYSQRACRRELEQAALICQHFQIAHRTVSLPWFADFSAGGKLLQAGELPEPTLVNLASQTDSEQSARAVWVPNRNGVMIEVAAGIAEDLGADKIIVGFNQEEAATFPDNSMAYLSAINHALSFSTANQVEVVSPTAQMDKKQLVRAAKELQFPFSLLWSCYQAGEKMCGRCESCARLKRALKGEEISFDGLFEDISLR